MVGMAMEGGVSSGVLVDVMDATSEPFPVIGKKNAIAITVYSGETLEGENLQIGRNLSDSTGNKKYQVARLEGES